MQLYYQELSTTKSRRFDDSFKYLPSNLKKIKIYFVGRGNSEFIKSMKIKILNNKLYDNFVFTGILLKIVEKLFQILMY